MKVNKVSCTGMSYPEIYRNDPTKRTPWISMEPGRIFIMGRSIPDDSADFYKPVQSWIAGYAGTHSNKTHIDLGFEYINTSSTKWIFSMLKELSETDEVPVNVKVNWYYERGDDDMRELGTILKSLIKCPFRLVEVGEMNSLGYERIHSVNTL